MEITMTIKEYQKQIDDYYQQFDPPYWTPHEILARLTEEVGELARIINHDYGPKKKKPGDHHDTIGEESADIIFALICLANREGIELDIEIQRVINKSQTRDKNRFGKKATKTKLDN